jgi:hypothetical protein
MALTYTTATSTLAKLYRKVQGNVLWGFQKKCPEIGLVKRLKEFDLDASAREVTTPIAITRQPAGAFISEFGYEAIPKTEAPQELTFPFVQFNDRYSFSKMGEHLDRTQRKAQLVRQAEFQTARLIEALSRRVSVSFYGVSTGYMCETTTDATQSSGTYALNDAFGYASFDDTTYLSRLFVVGDYVALIRSGALVTNAIGIVTAVSTSGIAVTWAGSVNSDPADFVVLANSSGHLITTGVIAHTDYNKAPNGLVDFLITDSVHGMATSSYPLWGPAGMETSAARLTGPRIKKAQHEISNTGGGDANLFIHSQGINRDIFANTTGAVQFNDPLGMEILGDFKTKGIRQFTSQYTPAGFACVMDDSAIKRWTITPLPGEDTKSIENLPEAQVDKVQDISGSTMGFDFIYNWVCVNRGNLYGFANVVES